MKKFVVLYTPYNLRRFAFDLFNGIRSGIPLCCVTQFCWYVIKGNTIRVSRELDGKRGKDRKDVTYVRCNICFKHDKVKEIKGNGCLGLWMVKDAER